jgi:hypothetical protein
LYLGDTNPAPGSTTELNQGFHLETGAKVCTGIVKLTQKALLCLMTYAHYYDPMWGTDMAEMLSVRNFSQAAVSFENIFPLAADRARELLRSQELDTDPYDERIADITLESLSTNRADASMSARIRVESVAGAYTVLTLPVEKLIGSGSSTL